MKYLIDFIVGCLRGGFFVILVVFVLFTIANVAFGDDTVATRDATLGEQDRSLNYTIEDANEDVESTVTVTIERVERAEEDVRTCEETNMVLKASKDYAERRIKDNPKYAYLYDEVLELIEEKWCHDDD